MSDNKRVNRLLQKVRTLRQCDESWEGTSRLARTWIIPRNKPPYRPYLFFVVTADGAILRCEVKQALTPEQLFEELLQAMCRPAWGAGRARRPKVLYLDNAVQVAALAPQLAALNISCKHRHRLLVVNDVVSSMEKHMNRGREPIPGLLQIPSVSVPLVGHLFELAAEYYQSTPWRLDLLQKSFVVG